MRRFVFFLMVSLTLAACTTVPANGRDEWSAPTAEAPVILPTPGSMTIVLRPDQMIGLIGPGGATWTIDTSSRVENSREIVSLFMWAGHTAKISFGCAPATDEEYMCVQEDSLTKSWSVRIDRDSNLIIRLPNEYRWLKAGESAKEIRLVSYQSTLARTEDGYIVLLHLFWNQEKDDLYLEILVRKDQDYEYHTVPCLYIESSCEKSVTIPGMEMEVTFDRETRSVEVRTAKPWTLLQ